MDSRGAAVLTAFVLDASAAMVLVMDDEPAEPVVPLLAALRDGDPVVPALWHFEIANALTSARRRGRVDDASFAQVVAAIAGMRTTSDGDPPGPEQLIALADQHDLTPYDAAYLGAALRRGIPLATTDTHLARAAARAGVPLII